MAKLPALVSALAEVDGRDRPTIDHIARTIREAGYIPTGKRGVGAAEMDTRAAANLLIALASTETIRDIPTEIDRFRSLRFWHASGAEGSPLSNEDVASLPGPLSELTETTTLGEAMERLVEGVPELACAFLAYGTKAYPSKTIDQVRMLFDGGHFGLSIEFRQYLVNVELYGVNKHGNRETQFLAVFTQDEDRFAQGFYGKKPRNRQVSVSLNFKMLMTAWNSISPEHEIAG
jgi:hypothetical protein